MTSYASHCAVGNYIVDVRLGWSDALKLTDGTEPLSYFTRDSSPDQWTVFPNDWRYAVPGDVEHLVVWTRRPIIDPAILPLQFHPGGIWSIAGCEGETLAGHPDSKLQELVERAAIEMNEFVKRHWPEDVYETAFFVNPTVSDRYFKARAASQAHRIQKVKQSIPGIAHFHLFVKRKGSPSAFHHEIVSTNGGT